MAANACGVLARCPKCGAVKNDDGTFDRSPGKVIFAASLEGISLERCGECAGVGRLLGGFSRRSKLGLLLSSK